MDDVLFFKRALELVRHSMTEQGPPYRPVKRGGDYVARRLLVMMPLVTPGIAAAGIYWLIYDGSGSLPLLGRAVNVLLLGGFPVILVGCSVFAGWMVSSDSAPEWRRQHWTDAAVMAGLLQIVVTPVLAWILIAFFLAGR